MKKIVITLMLVLVAVVAFGQADSTKVKKKKVEKISMYGTVADGFTKAAILDVKVILMHGDSTVIDTMTVWENPDKCCVDHFTVSIFGDLRDHDDPQGIVDWFKGKVEEFGYSARNATIVATNECNGSATWSDGIGHERRQN